MRQVEIAEAQAHLPTLIALGKERPSIAAQVDAAA